MQAMFDYNSTLAYQKLAFTTLYKLVHKINICSKSIPFGDAGEITWSKLPMVA